MSGVYVDQGVVIGGGTRTHVLSVTGLADSGTGGANTSGQWGADIDEGDLVGGTWRFYLHLIGSRRGQGGGGGVSFWPRISFDGGSSWYEGDLTVVKDASSDVLDHFPGAAHGTTEGTVTGAVKVQGRWSRDPSGGASPELHFGQLLIWGVLL